MMSEFIMEEFEDEADAELDGYLFPYPQVLRMEKAELLALIESNIADATDMVDGTDANADVRIDVAQDLIEQVRDRLLAMGHEFTAQERRRLGFLRWPPSPEEVERERLEEERRWATRRRRKWCGSRSCWPACVASFSGSRAFNTAPTSGRDRAGGVSLR